MVGTIDGGEVRLMQHLIGADDDFNLGLGEGALRREDRVEELVAAGDDDLLNAPLRVGGVARDGVEHGHRSVLYL